MRDDSTTERWLPVPGYEGLYEVSNLGRVRSLPHCDWRGYRMPGRLLNPRVATNGYPMFSLRKNSQSTFCCLHTVVTLAFLGPRQPGQWVNHKDGCKTNNTVENLEYVTPGENLRLAYEAGLHPSIKGIRHGPETKHVRGEQLYNAKVTDSDVRAIRALKGQMTIRTIATRFGISHSSVVRIQQGYGWKHVS